MEQLKRTFTASATGLRNSDPLYLQVEMVICSTTSNLNGVRVTPAFISDIVANSERYVGIPLSADVKRIEIGDLRRLGHMYNERTGKFGSTQIGSLVEFAEFDKDNEKCLTSIARVPRRHEAVCEAMEELYEAGNLNFSFEVTAGDYSNDPDGTIVIDVSPDNFLDGLAIVTYPAYPEAKALRLVAEILNGGNNMNEAEVQNEVIAEAVAESAEVKAEEVSEATEAQVAEEVATCKPQAEEAECKKAEEAECKKAEQEAECKKAEEEAECKKAEQEAECKRSESETEAECKKAEEEEAPCEQAPEEKECISDIIAKLNCRVAELENIVAELKANKPEVIVSQEERNEVVENPFVAEINIKSRYSLLEPEKKEERRRWTIL